MKSYTITFRETPHDLPQSTVFRGYDAEHAERRFLDSMEEEGGNEGVVVVSVVRALSISQSIRKYNATR